MHGVTAKKIDDFFSQYPVKSYAKNQILIYEGDKLDGVYYLRTGIVKVSYVSKRGEEVIIDAYEPTDYFPVRLAMSAQPSQYFYETETDVTLHKAPVDETLKFIRSNPSITYSILKRIGKSADEREQRLALMMTGTVRQRLAFELVTSSERYGEYSPDGTWTLRLNENALAARIGITRETVNREVRNLKTQNLLLVGKKGLVIPDKSKIEALIGF